jgi:hypothetical protein
LFPAAANEDGDFEQHELFQKLDVQRFRRPSMSLPEKRAREDKRDQKRREKEQRRRENKFAPRKGPELVTAAEIIGNVPSIDEVMQNLLSGQRVQRAAPPLPTKLFVGSLSDATTSAKLRAHFEPYGAIAEAVVITDRDSGRTRNFGFVSLADRKDAPRAIQATHQSELDGSVIVVNVATVRR